MTKDDWQADLEAVVEALTDINGKRQDLLDMRQDLLVLGYLNGWATKSGLAEISGVSRGRIQQLVNAPAPE